MQRPDLWRQSWLPSEQADRTQRNWYPLDGLPEPMVAYCRAGLDAYRAGLPAAVHFQHPGDPVQHAPAGPDRSRLLPGPPTDGV
ncbi:hypothetical protein [Streptomyces sp. NBC_01244]|uniref:hypothetical protein n=1 Tax=Streptomyces sp. NBC_01244 TaxID=2903797 RepID=UPI002E109C10|nr:hypothetical protein OG247_38225 [Streptomyces sp. NBC_01244]